MNIKEMVKDKVVRFKFYRDGELVYETEDGFEFPVPISDTGTGVFKAEDKALLFMRWIRKAVDEREAWEKQRIRETTSPQPLYAPTVVKELYTDQGVICWSATKELKEGQRFKSNEEPTPEGFHPIYEAELNGVRGWVIETI